MKNNSKIFVQNRVLGYVSNDIPLVTRYIQRRKENLAVTCVGKSFYTWGCNRFSLLSVSSQHEDEIIGLAANNFLIFTSSGNIIQAWRRGVELKQTYSSSSQTPILLMLPFGSHLIGIDESNILTVWDVKSQDIYLELNFSIDNFRITAMCHPQNYFNKILLGSEQGELQLWNINTCKLIYSFVGWQSPVTVLTPSTAFDIVAIGLQSGKILLHNIRYNETVITFIQDWGPVKSLSFRTDGAPIMASGSPAGHIVLWNLEERSVMSQILNAHKDSVNSLEFLPNEPLLVTSSCDNSLKLWIFDQPDGGGRLLRIREGHSAPPTFIRYHGNLGSYILSAGCDGYLKAFNTVTEIANKNLGRADYRRNKKRKKKVSVETEELQFSSELPPIVQFTSETTREKEWDNIAAIHGGIPIISTWSFDKCKLGSYLYNKKFKTKMKFRYLRQNLCTFSNKIYATSIFLTHCGNFLLVGYNSGFVDKFNIQSGILRGSYGIPKAHDGAVNGVCVNNINQIVITGATDNLIKFWSFRYYEKMHIFQIDVGDAVLFFRCHNESSILAAVLEDFTTVVLDTDSRSVIRRFSGHIAQVTDAAFSPDSRWLISASMDSTLQTWDIPSGKCIDLIQLDKPCTSLTFCPTGAYLATTHVGMLGIVLWSNLCMFSFLSLKPIVSEVVQLDDDSDIEVNENSQNTPVHNKNDISSKNNLITLLSNEEVLPITSRWQNILNIDIIRMRNRTKNPPKIQEEAPFFLPTIPSINMQFDLSDVQNETSNTNIIKTKKLQSSTFFSKLFSKAANNGQYQEVIDKIKTLSPSVVNFEIISLSPENGGSTKLMLQFLEMFKIMFKSKKHFELSVSYLGLFLRTHSSVIIEEQQISDFIEELYNIHQNSWSNLENKLLYCISVSKFLKDL